MKRIISRESFFITTFQNTDSDRERVAFGAYYPGKIIPMDLTKSGPMICRRDAYPCSAYGIDISIAFTKRLGAGFFGGEGFILQKLQGDGLAFVHAGGAVMEMKLSAGESLRRVDTGCLVGIQESVDYDIQFVGGIKTAFFGDEGLFFAKLTGPGTVYLQTLPFSRLADRIAPATRSSTGEVKRGGPISGVLGNIIGGDR